MLKLKAISILLFLMICAGCSTASSPNIVVQTKLVNIYPPEQLLKKPPLPQVVEVNTTRDLVTNSDAFEDKMKVLYNQLQQIIDWVTKAKEL